MIHGERYTFGVSGRLYQRNALYYDRETGSLWSQLLSEAVTGPMTGARLQALPAEDTTWAAWRRHHPDTLVLSFDTGYRRDYDVNPYARWKIPRRPALLISANGEMKIYPYFELQKTGAVVTDHLGGETVRIVYDRSTQSAQAQGKRIVWFVAYLDRLRAFYPRAEVYRALQ